MTSFTITPEMIVTAIVALILGILLGMLLRSGWKRRALDAEGRLAALSGDFNTLLADRDALRLERDSLDERVRPLAAEVDRLKRVETRRTTTTGDVLPVERGVETRRTTTSGDVLPVERTVAPVGVANTDDVRRLKGVGDRFAATLAELGITRIDQIAAMSGPEADALDAKLGSFAGRIRTDRLVEQARLLSEGRVTEYETRFGAL